MWPWAFGASGVSEECTSRQVFLVNRWYIEMVSKRRLWMGDLEKQWAWSSLQRKRDRESGGKTGPRDRAHVDGMANEIKIALSSWNCVEFLEICALSADF